MPAGGDHPLLVDVDVQDVEPLGIAVEVVVEIAQHRQHALGQDLGVDRFSVPSKSSRTGAGRRERSFSQERARALARLKCNHSGPDGSAASTSSPTGASGAIRKAQTRP